MNIIEENQRLIHSALLQTKGAFDDDTWVLEAQKKLLTWNRFFTERQIEAYLKARKEFDKKNKESTI